MKCIGETLKKDDKACCSTLDIGNWLLIPYLTWNGTKTGGLPVIAQNGVFAVFRLHVAT